MRAPPTPRHWCGAECGRHWYSGRAPDRLRRRVGAQAAGFVEREAEVVGQRRLARILGAVEPPFAGDVRRPRALGADPKVEDRGGGNGDDEQDGR